MSQSTEAAQPPALPARFRVGEWSVNRAEGSLCSAHGSVRLEPRVMDVLAYLAARPGKVVAKEELLEAVWGGAFVEEGALSQAVHSLRKAVGDDARQPRYIQTIPKRGYRLVAPVVPEAEAETGAEAAPGWPAPTRSEPAPPAPSRRPMRPWLWMALAVLLAAGVLWVVRTRQRPGSGKEAVPGAADGVRIVVLPFENLGKPENAYFAAGMTEEITKDLASLPSLQVISRTSAMQYAGVRKSLPEIGRELGVAYVLEGTVRWAEGTGGQARVRITPQLIRVADDAHVWADAFERDVKDIFQVQAEISRRVIDGLGLTLLPQQRRALGVPPTSNLEAYQAYLRGLELRRQPFYSESNVRTAVTMFERAVELDPGFAAAWAELSQTHSYLAFNSDLSQNRIEKARNALERAVGLAPDLLAVRLAQASFTYHCLGDFDAAFRQLSALRQSVPNDAEVLQTLGFVLRRRGQIVESIRLLEQSSKLDPRRVMLVWAIGETHRALRNYELAESYFARAISLAPDQPEFWREKALNWLAWTGDPEGTRAIVERAPVGDRPELLPFFLQLDMYERRFAQVIARLSPERIREFPPLERCRLGIQLVLAHDRLGDRRGALSAAERSQSELLERLARYPDDSFSHAYLAVVLAQMGRRAEALAHAERAVRQERHDTFYGPRMVQLQAKVDAILGRRREAISHLAHLLAIPYQDAISVAELRLDPIWDQLRGERAFEELLRRPPVS
jgi:TolB-like protein/DNA-binding winged helix-turn-helix (wHTH) protein/cytochrome c-type biogenesis protein CcmH/NrfG